MSVAAKNSVECFIDGRQVIAPEGTTILQAAALKGIHIPSICYRGDCAPETSCMVCVVRVQGKAALVPSCATKVANGMIIESDTAEVKSARKMAVELLLSEHRGECTAPCVRACPAHIDIPRMIRQIGAADYRGAADTVRLAIALPAVLGRVCTAPCENACRRGRVDSAVSICLLKRFAADAALNENCTMAAKPATGKSVAVIGAGPTGLCAAFYLLREGHACSIFERNEELGGSLRSFQEQQLPRKVLDSEIDAIRRLGARFVTKTEIGNAELTLLDAFDAIVCAAGENIVLSELLGLEIDSDGIKVDPRTHRTSKESIFAGGSAVNRNLQVIRAAADGREIACSINQYLRGEPVVGERVRFDSRIGKIEADESSELMKEASAVPRAEDKVAAGLSPEAAMREATRCMHCDCRRAGDCKLRESAESCEAMARLSGQGRCKVQRILDKSGVVYEPGKCVRCGLCIQISSGSKNVPGLTYAGRGFDVKVSAPFGISVGEALGDMAGRCVEACPTGALAWAETKK